ncbi:uncharacterized protein LOC116297996 isoform X2 [Actinia tenebrosa]|nr:uncharacterized protein LOC116297996 isoform X2 [Actinia tenebrosa]
MTSFNAGPVHSAVRRMTELIDLENLEGYFDEYLLETTSTQSHDEDGFDTLPLDKDCSLPDMATPPPPRRITIESYTKICIQRSNDKSNEKHQSPSKNKSEDSKKVRREKNDSIDLTDVKRKQLRASTTSKVSHLEKNAWRDYGRSEKKDHYNRDNRTKWSWVLKFFCGVNQEFKWYSLKGKGMCLILPMAIFYIVLCVVLLPFIFAAAAVAALVLGAGLCSYLSLATKKVGVSSDDDSDKSCLEAIWWWA